MIKGYKQSKMLNQVALKAYQNHGHQELQIES